MLFDLSALNDEDNEEKAYSHEDKCAKYISEQINSDLSHQFGDIEEGISYHFDTASKWSLHDIVVYCISQAGPSKVYFATYAIKEYQARLLTTLLSKGAITELHALLDYRNEVLAPDAYQLLQENCKTMGVIRTHAKLVVIIGEKKSIIIAGSANFTTNTRADIGVVTCNKGVAEYRRDWVLKNIQDGFIK